MGARTFGRGMRKIAGRPIFGGRAESVYGVRRASVMMCFVEVILAE